MLTVADLRKRLDDVPSDAKLFVYVDARGIRVQAEWRDDQCYVITSPAEITAGGECE